MSKSTTPAELITREPLLSDRRGKTFADVVSDPVTPSDQVLGFFNDPPREPSATAEVARDRGPLDEP